MAMCAGKRRILNKTLSLRYLTFPIARERMHITQHFLFFFNICFFFFLLYYYMIRLLGVYVYTESRLWREIYYNCIRQLICGVLCFHFIVSGQPLMRIFSIFAYIGFFARESMTFIIISVLFGNGYTLYKTHNFQQK